MMLAVSDLQVSIGTHSVCRALSLSVATGASLAVLGPNGAGKSTLLASLAGLHAPDSGSIHLRGQALAAQAPRALARLRGYCAQHQHDAFAATVLETALVGRHPHLGRWGWESAADVARATSALQQTGLAELAAREVHTLSGGERQRLALATLLVQDPPLYLLDEPLSHLDLNHAVAVLELLRQQLQGGRSVVAVMHEPNLARRYFDQALLLFGDGSWVHGTVHEIINTDNLQRLYGHPVRALDNAGRPWFIPE